STSDWRAYHGKARREAERLRGRRDRRADDRRSRVCRRLSSGEDPPLAEGVVIADNGIFNFFSSGTWAVIRNLTLFFVAVFWLATAFWVFKDARRRIEGPGLVGMATARGLVSPFIGALIYMLVGPPDCLERVRRG